MKPKINKYIGISIIAFVIAMNVNSAIQFSIGGEEVRANEQTTGDEEYCNWEYTPQYGYVFKSCHNCLWHSNAMPDHDYWGFCSPSDPGEGE